MRMLMLFILLIAALCGCQSSQPQQPDKRILAIPSLNLLLTDSSTVINPQQIPPGKPTILVCFSPNCPFSRQQTKEIVTHYTQLQNYRLYFCSPEPLPAIKDFYNNYQLNKYKNITVGRDYELFFYKQLNIYSYPSLFIYNSANQLQKIATGFVSADMIVNFTNG